ncbi:MAG: inositol monophosphatase, partial [Candidatus Omnitrophica bacterium]|nr:inositol monophosphatase [Candidatus Omnitrophota bacterium]
MKKERFKNIALKAAMEAGRYIKKSVGKIKSIRYKGEINVVTDIDKRAEKIIVDTIKNKCPGHDFLAEENSYKSTGSDYRWIIDPLDGTTN